MSPRPIYAMTRKKRVVHRTQRGVTQSQDNAAMAEYAKPIRNGKERFPLFYAGTQARLGQARSGQVRSGQARSGQFSSVQVRSGQVRSGQVRSGQREREEEEEGGGRQPTESALPRWNRQLEGTRGFDDVEDDGKNLVHHAHREVGVRLGDLVDQTNASRQT